MFFIFYFLCLKLHRSPLQNASKEQAERQITKRNNLLEDDFIYPTDVCQSTLDEEDNNTIIISNCTFEDCNKEEYVILYTNENSSFLLQDCTFQFSDYNKSSSVIYSTASVLQIINNEFIRCNKNTINYKPTDYTDFQLISNFFSECYMGTLVNFYSPTTYDSSPTIRSNIFEKVSINEPSFVLKIGDGIQITFQNDTFREFTIDSEFGGIGLKVETSLSSYSLFFYMCKFVGNKNLKEKNGGALFGNYETDGNVRYYLSFCDFEKNSAEEDGGAVCMRIMNSVSIYKCKFVSNKASRNGGAVCIEPCLTSSYSLYAINNCTFVQNLAGSFGSSFYLCNKAKSSKPVTFDKCQFEGGDVYIIDCPTSEMIISNSHFTNITSHTSLFVQQLFDVQSINAFKLTNCVFNKCSSLSSSICFNLSLMTKYVTFDKVTVRDITAGGCDAYIGIINLNKKTSDLVLTNWSFYNNVCKSLYGGGIGTLFEGIETITFIECKFVNNKSKQDKSEARSTVKDVNYYNGDGGGIQLGYSSSLSDIEVVFEQCIFKKNEADRHGGALAIQTLRTVSIVKCSFNGNVANSIKNTVSILEEDYYNLKEEGRGGAIYINPSFSNQFSKFMSNVEIENCSFVSNNAFDGYAIYVEGNDLGTNFSIVENDFIDNYNKERHFVNDKNHIHGAVIASEIDSLFEMINCSNSFSNSQDNIVVLPFYVVDHSGKGDDGSDETNSDDKKKKGLSKIAIIAIACGCGGFVLIAVVVTIVVIFILRKKKKKNIDLNSNADLETQMIPEKENNGI